MVVHWRHMTSWNFFTNSSGNGLSTIRWQVIIIIDAGWFSIGPFRTKFKEMWTKTENVFFQEIVFLSKWLLSLCLNVLELTSSMLNHFSASSVTSWETMNRFLPFDYLGRKWPYCCGVSLAKITLYHGFYCHMLGYGGRPLLRENEIARVT